MANQYAGAQNWFLPVSAGCIGAADVACSAGVETNVIASPTVKSQFNGDFYPLVLGSLTIYMGATPPTALVIAARIGAGADFASYTVDPGQLLANGHVNFPIGLVGPNSASAWFPNGGVINVSVNATGQAVTCKNVGSFALFQLNRGPNI